ncbi:hypothetical protein ACWEPR_37070, partial [Streptomyces sp. NPDC004290]
GGSWTVRRSCAALSGHGSVDKTGRATRHAQVDRLRAPLVDLRKLVLRSGEADSQSFDLAEPAFALGLGNGGNEVVYWNCLNAPGPGPHVPPGPRCESPCVDVPGIGQTCSKWNALMKQSRG